MLSIKNDFPLAAGARTPGVAIFLKSKSLKILELLLQYCRKVLESKSLKIRIFIWRFRWEVGFIVVSSTFDVKSLGFPVDGLQILNGRLIFLMVAL